MKLLLEKWREFINEAPSYYMGEAKDSNSVVKAVIIKDRGALLLLRSASEKYPNKWDLPGGHIHEGEDAKDGLLREVKEETQIELQEPIEKFYEKDNITYFKVLMPEQNVILSHEHTEYLFVSVKDLPKNISDKFVEAIKKAL